MTALAWLIPAALALGLLGLLAFLWALRSGQFEDLEGASWRAIQDSERPDPPTPAEQDEAPSDPRGA
ncbi:MAG TPA: cbb3-type cytochrome oxidase assembly protein CcoS [Hyphomicrobium sp.]|jgi:cbb3-type cytochrome oxidase maturation protein